MTSNDYVPVVNIVTWILLVSMVLAVCTKVAMKVIGRRTFNIDDSVLVAAMVKLSNPLALSQLRKWSLCLRSSAVRNRLLFAFRHTMALGDVLTPSPFCKSQHTRRFHALSFDVQEYVDKHLGGLFCRLAVRSSLSDLESLRSRSPLASHACRFP